MTDEELRNLFDFRLHVMGEARALLALLPPGGRRNAVLVELGRLIEADWSASKRLREKNPAAVIPPEARAAQGW